MLYCIVETEDDEDQEKWRGRNKETLREGWRNKESQEIEVRKNWRKRGQNDVRLGLVKGTDMFLFFLIFRIRPFIGWTF